MSYTLIMFLLCIILLIYFNFRRNKLRDKSYQYLIKYLSEPNEASSTLEWMNQLNEQFNREVTSIYNKGLDDLTKEELLDLFSKILKQKSWATLERRSFHKNALTIIYYNIILKIEQRGIMKEDDIKEYEYEKLKESFSQTEISKLR